jgi:hypothetical protein
MQNKRADRNRADLRKRVRSRNGRHEVRRRWAARGERCCGQPSSRHSQLIRRILRNQGFQPGFHGIPTSGAAAQIRSRRGAPSGAARDKFGGRTARPAAGCAEPTDCAGRRTVARLRPDRWLPPSDRGRHPLGIGCRGIGRATVVAWRFRPTDRRRPLGRGSASLKAGPRVPRPASATRPVRSCARPVSIRRRPADSRGP